MSKPRLVIEEDRRGYGWYIAWFMPEDGDLGAELGEKVYTERDLERCTDPSDREHITASIAVAKMPGCERRDGAYRWESKSQAQAALKVAKLAVANVEHPWPDWALQAKAAGWTPPKGWKP